MDLSELRKKIDQVDVKIVKLLENRFNLVKEIRKIKKYGGLPLEDKKREKEIIERLTSSGNLDQRLVEEIYQAIFKYAKNAQDNPLQE